MEFELGGDLENLRLLQISDLESRKEKGKGKEDGVSRYYAITCSTY